MYCPFSLRGQRKGTKRSLYHIHATATFVPPCTSKRHSCCLSCGYTRYAEHLCRRRERSSKSYAPQIGILPIWRQSYLLARQANKGLTRNARTKQWALYIDFPISLAEKKAWFIGLQAGMLAELRETRRSIRSVPTKTKCYSKAVCNEVAYQGCREEVADYRFRV